jgi:hypothetical protein
MSRDSRNRIVGFDRKIRLDWLDSTAMWTAQGCPPSEIRSRLNDLLDGTVVGMKARANTVSVLVHVWVQVPGGLEPLRDDGLALLEPRRKRDRLPLHWGMCMATYPFFRSVASAAGRLTAVQGTASLSQITRRVTEGWGERSTVRRAVQRVVRSLVLWRVLTEEGDRGLFAPATKLRLPNSDPVGAWLLEAALAGFGGSPRPLDALRNDAALFPFSLDVTASQLAARPGMEIHRQGLDEELVLRIPVGGR